jgi:hypothetical protein
MGSALQITRADHTGSALRGLACSATIKVRTVLPHRGMLPNGPSTASPECSRRVGILSIGAEPIMLKSLSMAAASMLNLASNLIVEPRVSDHAWR